VLAGTRNLLLDFDGPVCEIFAGLPAPTITAQLLTLLAARGITVPDELASEGDPLQVLRATSRLGDDQAVEMVAGALREAEVRAVETAAPTPGFPDVLDAARATGRRLAIVSNNSQQAVEAYLQGHDLLGYFDQIVGRYNGQDPESLKPSPHLVWLTMTPMGATPATTALVGDSMTDIEAARAVPIDGIGYANKPGKDARLAAAGASAIVYSMAELAAALSERPISGLLADTAEAAFRAHGGIRVTPRTGGGVRWSGSLGTATLLADRDVITIKTPGWGTLVVNRRNLTSIRPWRYALNHGVRFETDDCDDTWIFRVSRPHHLLDGLNNLGWPTSP
jgi:phosphoglycolate phosphatase-like HAD superfamily hydrolase